jgi:hypothetical protein
MSGIVKEFAYECAEDFVGLWSIVWKVRSVRPGLAEAREATLEIVRALLDPGQIVAGQMVEERGFVRWHESPNDAVRRIRREWVALGREPNLGDIVWFVRLDIV